MIYLSIFENSKSFPVEAQCKILNVSRNAYYHWLNTFQDTQNERSQLFIDILQIFYDSHGTYGAPRITAVLHQNGSSISQKKVSNIMRILNISSIHSSNFPTHKSSMTPEEILLINNLILNLSITHINQVWTTDITYIHTVYDGTLYLISFMDLFSRRIVGWTLGRSQKTSEVIVAFTNAIKKRKPLPGLIVHSDKGAQFRSHLYREFVMANGFLYSYTQLNHSCDQNANQESFHATLKKEWLSSKNLYYYEDTYKAIFDFIEGFYNIERLHSSLGYMSPIQFEKSTSM